MKAFLSEATLVRIQAVSGLLFASFLALHLLNTAVAPFGQGSYDGLQQALRLYYQFPVVELVAVLGSAMTHMGVGLWRGIRRLKAGQKPPHWPLRLHRLAGYFLMLVFAGHVMATRGVGVFFGLPADFAFLTFSLTYFGSVFYPYYLLLGLAGLFHLVFGLSVAVRVLKWRVPVPVRWASLVGAPFMVAGVLALGGAFFQVDTGRFEKLQAFYETWLPDYPFPWKR